MWLALRPSCCTSGAGYDWGMEDLLRAAAQCLEEAERARAKRFYRDAYAAYQRALDTIHGMRPRRERDVLLARIYLDRFQIAKDPTSPRAVSDLRFGYSYARSTGDSVVREVAEELWREHVAREEAS